MRTHLVFLFATAAIGWAAGGPARAEVFDLPPMVGGEGGGPPAAEAAEGAPDAIGVPETAPVEDEIPVPDIRPDHGSDAGIAAPAEPQPVGNRDTTLELEVRALQNEGLDGSSTAALRGSAHWFGHRSLDGEADLIFNLRARASKVEDVEPSFDESLRVDVQELALSYPATTDLMLEVGRLNIRNGVALGFNPTDWFKADSLVTTDSQDPGDRREERLGTVILGGIATVGGALYQFGFRPQITDGANSILTDMDVIGLGLDRTNPSEAVFVKVSPDLGGNISVTGNLLLENGHPGGGFEISGAIGDNLVLYGEAFIQERRSLASKALAGGLGSPGFRGAVGANGGYGWKGQATIGATWSLPAALVGQEDVSLSFEYHYNGAGLSGGQIDALAAAKGADLAAAGAIQGFAAREQEPLAREQLFARLAWNDVWEEADLTALGFYVPHDNSGLVQLSASMPLNDNAEFSVRAFSTFGGSSSIYGANPTEMTAQIALTFTF